MRIKKLRKGSESQTRDRLIKVSRSADADYLPQLLALVQSNESAGNRRHAVRALGNIGGRRAEQALLQVLAHGAGAILGDAAQALGKLRCKEAAPRLRDLQSSRLVWVAEQATRALKQIERR